MRALVEALCSVECAGRAAGSEGGRRARDLVAAAFEEAGLRVEQQPVPGCDGTNLLARVRGDGSRWVLVGAHYDHLGTHGSRVFHGADDNAAAVAVLVEVGRALAARPPKGRSVLLAAFDGEEPPHFMSEAMGSARFCAEPLVPLAEIDLMVAMDLVGHAVGPPGLPDAVRTTLFGGRAQRGNWGAGGVGGGAGPGGAPGGRGRDSTTVGSLAVLAGVGAVHAADVRALGPLPRGHRYAGPVGLGEDRGDGEVAGGVGAGGVRATGAAGAVHECARRCVDAALDDQRAGRAGRGVGAGVRRVDAGRGAARWL